VLCRNKKNFKKFYNQEQKEKKITAHFWSVFAANKIIFWPKKVSYLYVQRVPATLPSPKKPTKLAIKREDRGADQITISIHSHSFVFVLKSKS
jgi:hypothetical protein